MHSVPSAKGVLARSWAARGPGPAGAAATAAGSAAWPWRAWAAPVCSRWRSGGTGCPRSAPKLPQTVSAESQPHASESGPSLRDSAHTSPCHPYQPQEGWVACQDGAPFAGQSTVHRSGRTTSLSSCSGGLCTGRQGG